MGWKGGLCSSFLPSFLPLASFIHPSHPHQPPPHPPTHPIHLPAKQGRGHASHGAPAPGAKFLHAPLQMPSCKARRRAATASGSGGGTHQATPGEEDTGAHALVWGLGWKEEEGEEEEEEEAADVAAVRLGSLSLSLSRLAALLPLSLADGEKGAAGLLLS